LRRRESFELLLSAINFPGEAYVGGVEDRWFEFVHRRGYIVFNDYNEMNIQDSNEDLKEK
jgi:hypothetical protein